MIRLESLRRRKAGLNLERSLHSKLLQQTYRKFVIFYGCKSQSQFKVQLRMAVGDVGIPVLRFYG
jgi:hypothetical protein